jgi:nucleoside-diphosphate-sugar epimerase
MSSCLITGAAGFIGSHLFKNIEVVFHLAAMAGLVRSWSDFNLYMTCNTEVTQRLLEVVRPHDVRHFIHGSTSSQSTGCWISWQN